MTGKRNECGDSGVGCEGVDVWFSPDENIQVLATLIELVAPSPEANFWVLVDPIFVGALAEDPEEGTSGLTIEYYGIGGSTVISVDSTNLPTLAHKIRALDTVIAGSRCGFSLENSSLSDEWESGNVTVYMECVDALYWHICAKDAGLIEEVANRLPNLTGEEGRKRRANQ